MSSLQLDVRTPSRPTSHTVRLPRDPCSVREARGFVRERLVTWGLDDLADDASLVVTELATNAVVHAHSPYTVTALRHEGTVRLEVHDDGPGAVQARGWSASALGGRGLALVAALTSAWGVETDGAGKTVWAELVA